MIVWLMYFVMRMPKIKSRKLKVLQKLFENHIEKVSFEMFESAPIFLNQCIQLT